MFPNTHVDAELSRATALAIRARSNVIARTVAPSLHAHGAPTRASALRGAERLIDLIATALEDANLHEAAHPVVDRRWPTTTTCTVRDLFACVYLCEHAALNELARDERVGALSRTWHESSELVMQAAFEVLAVLTEHRMDTGGVEIPDDQDKALLPGSAFRLVLAQEASRARRHDQPLSLILFDLANLPQIEASQGRGVGTRLVARMAILMRRFFRTYDWVGHHGDHAVAALLPETALDCAMRVASRARDMVEQRLVFEDHRSGAHTHVMVRAAAVGTSAGGPEIDVPDMLRMAEEALERAHAVPHDVERVELMSNGVSVLCAASLLSCGPGVVRRLVRSGSLPAVRRGRHYQIDRAAVERLQALATAPPRTSP